MGTAGIEEREKTNVVVISMIGIAFVLFSLIAVYSCLVVAGRADDYLEQMVYEKRSKEKSKKETTKAAYQTGSQPAPVHLKRKQQFSDVRPVVYRGASRDIRHLRNSRRPARRNKKE